VKPGSSEAKSVQGPVAQLYVAVIKLKIKSLTTCSISRVSDRINLYNVNILNAYTVTCKASDVDAVKFIDLYRVDHLWLVYESSYTYHSLLNVEDSGCVHNTQIDSTE
jgi:hypothetical protein